MYLTRNVQQQTLGGGILSTLIPPALAFGYVGYSEYKLL